ncbi:hypothetical protein R1flu_025173 [Riccia fluitans]|uniref:Pseudouridine synthase RsuA/RluA-like domain-containing protein n=1 Tax=Riccia fluitans TaxID=41844 RepID=A0ABD1Y013_9MARC
MMNTLMALSSSTKLGSSLVFKRNVLTLASSSASHLLSPTLSNHGYRAVVSAPLRGIALQTQSWHLSSRPFVNARAFNEVSDSVIAFSDVAIKVPDLTPKQNLMWCSSDGDDSTARVVEYGRLLPCPPGNMPPRVVHLILREKGKVADVVSKSLSLPRTYVEDLIDFGAVHYALLWPTPPADTRPEQFELYKQLAPLYQDPVKRPYLKRKTIKEAQKTFRVTTRYLELDAGSYLRVHVHPKRFPRCYEVDWKKRIIAETKSYVVLDKPASVSVGGTVDNLVETCANFTARALGQRTPLAITHQIDTCTEGCVVLAKTKEFASKFHELLRDKKVRKMYKAIATSPMPVGRITHYMRADRHPPRLISNAAHEGWALCEMEVKSCKQVEWPSQSTMKKIGIKSSGWKVQDYAYELTIQLLTGRTHQIRAQCAAMGAPLLGDSMYLPAAIARLKFPEVDPVLTAPFSEDESSWIGNIKDRRDGGVMETWVSMHGREPEALGLQASQLSWDDGKIYKFKAGLPWWET